MSSSYDFQAHLQRSQRRYFPRLLYCDSRCSQSCRRRSEACRRRTETCHRRSQTCRRRSQACPRCSQSCRQRSQACRKRSHALPGAPNVLSGAPRCSQTYHNHSHRTPVAVIWDPSYSEGRQECPPRVWYSPEIDASKITLHILSDTPGVFQWLKYILLMKPVPTLVKRYINQVTNIFKLFFWHQLCHTVPPDFILDTDWSVRWCTNGGRWLCLCSW